MLQHSACRIDRTRGTQPHSTGSAPGLLGFGHDGDDRLIFAERRGLPDPAKLHPIASERDSFDFRSTDVDADPQPRARTGIRRSAGTQVRLPGWIRPASDRYEQPGSGAGERSDDAIGRAQPHPVFAHPSSYCTFDTTQQRSPCVGTALRLRYHMIEVLGLPAAVLTLEQVAFETRFCGSVALGANRGS